MDQAAIITMLSGGDRRSTGRADHLALLIADDPAAFGEAVALMASCDPLIAMRAADAVEKASRDKPALLLTHNNVILGPLAALDQQEVRWHWLQMVARMPLDDAERTRAFAVARTSLDHPSRIVAAEALTALFALSREDAALRDQAQHAAEVAMTSGAPSLRARARRLLASAC